MTIFLIDIVVTSFDTCIDTLIFETNNIILCKSEVPIFSIWEYCVVKISNVSRSVCKLYLRASYHVYKIGCLLVRGISLSAVQLFVIAIENILWGRCGQFNKSDNAQ